MPDCPVCSGAEGRRRPIRVNLRIFRMVPTGYITGKLPKRHSGMLAGIEGLESLLDPG